MNKVFIAFTLMTSALFAESPINSVTNDTPNRGSSKLMVQNELATLDALINVTEQNLKNQQKLKTEIQGYQSLQAKYLNDTENTELLFQVAKSANQITTDIEENNLSHTFSPEFIKELKLFSQVGKKRGIPQAR